MKKFKFFALSTMLIITAFALTGCGSTEIVGTVNFSIEDSPVEGAVVRIDDREVTTAADGSFSLAEVPRRTTEGRVTLEGFPDYEFSFDLREAEESYSIAIEIPAAQVIFVLEENTYDPNTVLYFVLTVDGTEVAHVELGEDMKSDILPPGTYEVRITSEIYEPFAAPIEFVEGKHVEEIELNIVLEESYRRFNQLNALHRYAESYNFIHPDVRALLSLPAWMGNHDHSATVINAAPEDLGVLEEWSSELTGMTYQNVATFKRAFITERGDSRRASTETQHWVLLSGRWYIVYPERFW